MASAKPWVLLAQLAHRLPEELLGDVGRASPVGVAQVVARRRCGPANGRERPRVQPQAVAHVVEADGMGHLRKEQRHGVAPIREAARFGRALLLVGELAHQPQRNEVAELAQDTEFGSGWLGCVGFHTSQVAATAALANSLSIPPVGWL